MTHIKQKQITPDSMHKLMESILRVLYRHEAAYMVNFYLNNKHYSTDKHDDREGYITHDLGNGRFYYENPNPVDVTQQIEYNNPKTITITFEGPMYHDINYGKRRIETEINKLAASYGLYIEYGYAWSLALYED